MVSIAWQRGGSELRVRWCVLEPVVSVFFVAKAMIGTSTCSTQIHVFLLDRYICVCVRREYMCCLFDENTSVLFDNKLTINFELPVSMQLNSSQSANLHIITP